MQLDHESPEDLIDAACKQLGLSREELKEKAENSEDVYHEPAERERLIKEMSEFLEKMMHTYEEKKDSMTIKQAATFMQRWNTAFEVYTLSIAVHHQLLEAEA